MVDSTSGPAICGRQRRGSLSTVRQAQWAAQRLRLRRRNRFQRFAGLGEHQSRDWPWLNLADGDRIQSFDVSDGLPNREFNHGAHLQHGSSMYFGTVQGFTMFEPNDIQINKNPPKVVLTEFLRLNEPVALALLEDEAGNVLLNHADQLITFRIRGVWITPHRGPTAIATAWSASSPTGSTTTPTGARPIPTCRPGTTSSRSRRQQPRDLEHRAAVDQPHGEVAAVADRMGDLGLRVSIVFPGCRDLQGGDPQTPGLFARDPQNELEPETRDSAQGESSKRRSRPNAALRNVTWTSSR